MTRKLEFSCDSWDQVQKLCDDQSAGRNHLTIPAAGHLRRGDRLMVALRLPDELVLSIAAEVTTVRVDPVTEQRLAAVYLVGLSPEVCTRMRAMCIGSSGGLRLSTYAKKLPRSSPPAAGQVIGVLRPRREISDPVDES